MLPMTPPARLKRGRSLRSLRHGTNRNGQLRSVQTVRDRAAVPERPGWAGSRLSVEREPEALRDRYGRHRFGQSLLLARRLVERGVSFAAVHFNHMTKCDGWDTHANNFQCLQGELLPMLDQGLSALL